MNAPKSFTNRSAGISRWHTSQQAKDAYTYIPAESPIPTLYAQDGKGDAAVAYVKLFTPDASMTFYLTEADRETGEAFGLVIGQETELGYVDLNELSAARGALGLPVERDLYFTPTTIGELREKHARD